MPFTDLAAYTAEQIKIEYEKPYTSAPEKEKHIHRKVYRKSGESAVRGNITYPVINLSALRNMHCGTLVEFLFEKFRDAGVRPDTPFHENKDHPPKYPNAGNREYRYMEFNAIGGGMRLIYDAVAGGPPSIGELFLSCHYSDPAVIRANAGTGDMNRLIAMLTIFRKTWTLLRKHSNGDIATWVYENGLTDKEYEARRKYLAVEARTSQMFIGWLSNKNSAQSKEVVFDLYSLNI